MTTDDGSPDDGSRDDRFHEPTSEDPFWTETCWFSFFVPERALSGTLYPLFRRNLGVASSGVHVWDASHHEPQEILYSRTLWHLPFPHGDLTDMALPSGLRYRCIEAGRRYQLGYDDGDEIAIDLEYEAVVDAHFIGHAHLDQHGRVRGTLRLGDETITVDCFGMRDRTWSVRDDLHGTVGGTATGGGYVYGMVSPDEAFQAIATTVDGTCTTHVGYVVRGGEMADVVGGTRTVLERKDGRPRRVAVELEDSLGRTLTAEGTCHNTLAWQFTPNLFSWNSLTEWAWDAGSGWGEDHDNWTNAGWRSFRRASSAL